MQRAAAAQDAGSGGSSNPAFLNVGDPDGGRSRGRDGDASGPNNGLDGAADGGFQYDPNDLSACAIDRQGARLSPVNLVFVYDKSGSMGDPVDGFDPAERWFPMNQGMVSFFSDPRSASLSAALSFFPVTGDVSAACAGPYDDPARAHPPGLPLTSLATPESRAMFSNLLTNTVPQGGTPTLPALQGGVALARSIAQTHPYETTVVVLVTDGEPGIWIDTRVQPGCVDNDLPHVAEAARTAVTGSPSIPVYAIGIGPSVGNLDTIAQAGGTGKATMIGVGDPARVTADLLATLESIRMQTFSCDFPIPPPPERLTFDPNQVNVTFTTAAGSTTLERDPNCTRAGWRYDSESAPTKILLCPAACRNVQQDTSGRIGIVFGCATHMVPVN